MFRKSMAALAFGLCAWPALAQAQTLTNLAHPAPEGADITLLLTDGTVLGQSAANGTHWYKLTPDITGSYQKGTWSRLADLPNGYQPYAMASAVLADGRVIIEGGEYNPGSNFSLTNLGAIYDPLANTWTMNPAPKGWGFIGDSSSLVLPDGRYLLSEKLNVKMAAFDPKTNTWTKLTSTGHNGMNSEETWTLMPDGKVLTMNVEKAPHTQLYDPATGVWTDLPKTPVSLKGPKCCKGIDYGGKHLYHPPGEIGPSILMPDGSVFATGGIPKGENTAHTAVYKNGVWTQGPDVPNHDDMGDNFASLLPNGHVVMQGISGRLYEYDGVSQIKSTSFNGSGNSLMVLPTGEVLIGGQAVYASPGNPDPSWAPTITNCPSTLTRGSSFTINGTQFNGLSQANSFGDELETFTNYPLVRITNNATGHVFYARTHDHSSMGVATGSMPVSTHVDVPAGMETGASKLVVVANGIASTPVDVTVN
ncbi:MAG: hypothetical protein JOZ72_17020 [Alphaproteobacteria bacterium]|nr:hypothetical protein [Alphaproteobacteria bacterium]